MGFWGTFVVHKGEPLLSELLPEVEAFRHAELEFDRVSGDWQVTRVFAPLEQLPTDLLARLRDATGAPVLAAEVMDSDGAFVRGLGKRTEWKVWLQLDGAMGYLLTPHDGDTYEAEVADLRERILAETPGGAAAAAAAIEWAREASLEPAGLDEVTRVIDGHEVFVEDLFIALLNRLGLATAEAERRLPLAPVEVVRERYGHRLEAVEKVPHVPVRGQWLAFPAMPDLRLHFDGRPAVNVCGCAGDFVFLPADDAVGEPADDAVGESVSGLAGQRLEAAATIRGSAGWLMGVVLRFEDGRVLSIAIADGTWAIVDGVLAGGYVNPWIAPVSS